MILFTDGENLLTASTTLSDITRVHNSGVTIIVVGFGTSFNINELAILASQPQLSNLFVDTTIDGLVSNKLNDIVDATCNDVDYCDSLPCLQSGSTCVSQVLVS